MTGLTHCEVQSKKCKRCKSSINRKLQYPWFTWHYPPSSWQGGWASARCWARDRTWNNLIFTWKKHQLLIICPLPVTSLAAPIVDHLKKTSFLWFEFPWYQGYNYNFSQLKLTSVLFSFASIWLPPSPGTRMTGCTLAAPPALRGEPAFSCSGGLASCWRCGGRPSCCSSTWTASAGELRPSATMRRILAEIFILHPQAQHRLAGLSQVKMFARLRIHKVYLWKAVLLALRLYPDLNIGMRDVWEARTGFERQRPTAVTQMTIFPMLWSTKSPFYADKTSDGCGCRVKIFKSCKRKTSPVLKNNSSSGSAIALRCIPATGTQDF